MANLPCSALRVTGDTARTDTQDPASCFFMGDRSAGPQDKHALPNLTRDRTVVIECNLTTCQSAQYSTLYLSIDVTLSGAEFHTPNVYRDAIRA